MNIFPAHIRETDGAMQTVSEHCRETAAYAKKALQDIRLGNTAYLAGLLHDMGKMTEEFSAYIQKAANGQPVRRGSVNHTFAGCRYLLESYHNRKSRPFSFITAEILAYAIGAHHGQFDCVDEDGNLGFTHRLLKEIVYTEAKENFLSECAGNQNINKIYEEATGEVENIYKILLNISYSREEVCFYLGLLTRLVLSSVVEGDRRDTAEFMAGIDYPEYNVDWQELLAFAEEKLCTLPAEKPIEKVRRFFSAQCAQLGEMEVGVYRLNLPTGAGKTLSSLRAALSHAAKQKKKRIIFVMPLLSIIDQNADIIRQYIKNPDFVLEHHSNVLQEEASGLEELNKNELLMESWSAPVIITTLVQFLNTLFSGRLSCVRRFHALSDAVIVIDEVQTVPIKMLSLFTLAVNFLSSVCHTTVVLCSATQPCLEETKHSLLPVKDLVPFDAALWKVFERTKIVEGKTCRIDDLGDYIKSQLKGNLLLVCNTKKEAALVYQQLKGVERYHLSASMCMAHRQRTLQKIENALESGRTFVCVATQVIEAGVDISFKQAIRVIAGMDNIIQTAGRCNRHRETDISEVQIVRCTDENLSKLKEIKDAQDATLALLDAFNRNPERFNNDLSSDEAIKQYYKELYDNQKEGAMDGIIKGKNLFEMLSDNSSFIPEECEEKYCLNQAFKTAGKTFTVFETETYDVVVPYEKGKHLISELGTERAKNDILYKKDLLEQLKPYTVSVYSYQKKQLQEQGALYEPNESCVLALQEMYYDEDALGLMMNPTELEFKEV